jgi:nicotinamidase/pyrazinamidase
MESVYFNDNIKIDSEDALIIIDLQNDFIPGGALPVEEGDLIIKDINKIAKFFKKCGSIVVLTQDWHPKEHLSFASNHEGKNPGDEYTSDDGGIGPVLWPDHCIQNSQGAQFHKDLKVNLANKIIQKGMNPKVDSYSGFQDNDKKSETELRDYLNSLSIKRIFICGLALDYCCYFTAMDGIDFGFDVFFLVNMTRGIDLPEGNIKNALENMNKSGIKIVKKARLK